MERQTIRINTIPMWAVSWVIWIVFMILYYGAGTISDWPVFWVWFPLWIPFAVEGAILLIFGLVAFLLYIFG